MTKIETIHEGKYLRLVKNGRWEYVQRVGIPGVVIIAALTPENSLLLVEQHRIPVDCKTIELPAGLAGDVPEDAGPDFLVKAAKRELLEETGYEAEHVSLLFKGPSTAGLTNEFYHCFKAHNLKKVGVGGGVDDEGITVHEVPLAEVPQWLKQKESEGYMLDSKIYSVLFFFRDEVDPAYWESSA